MLTDGISTLAPPQNPGGPQPIAGAVVTLVDATTGTPITSRIADDTGTYSFGYGVAGNYHLYAQAPGNAGKLWYDGAGFGELADVTPATITIVDSTTQIQGVDFAFPTGGFGGGSSRRSPTSTWRRSTPPSRSRT